MSDYYWAIVICYCQSTCLSLSLCVSSAMIKWWYKPCIIRSYVQYSVFLHNLHGPAAAPGPGFPPSSPHFARLTTGGRCLMSRVLYQLRPVDFSYLSTTTSERHGHRLSKLEKTNSQIKLQISHGHWASHAATTDDDWAEASWGPAEDRHHDGGKKC